MGIKHHPKLCSYFPLLLEALYCVNGDVLELGAGMHSTYFLHWFCYDQQRELHTYENNKFYYKIAKRCKSDWHRVHFITDWDTADIEREWGVVLVDHAPAMRRKIEAERLADWAQIILLHDSHWKMDKHYHYKELFPQFRYKYAYPRPPRSTQTTAVSNFIDVRKLAND